MIADWLACWLHLLLASEQGMHHNESRLNCARECKQGCAGKHAGQTKTRMGVWHLGDGVSCCGAAV